MPESLIRLHAPYTGGTSGCRHRREELMSVLAAPLAPDQRVDEIRTPILYGPIGYLPPALALVPARALGASAGELFYLARFANLVAWMAICMLAISLAPVGRWALATTALLPMSLFEAATVSGDAMTNALALLLLALSLRAAAPAAGAIERRDLAAIVGLVVLLGLGKPGYTLLALLVFAIPADRFSSVGERRSFVAAAIGAALAAPAGWWMVVQAAGPFPYPKADPAAQLAGIAVAPWRLLSVVGLSLGERAADYARGAIGVLGRLDVLLPSFVYAGYGLLLATVATTDDRRAAQLAPRTRATLGLVAVTGIAAITALLYVSASSPGAPRVAGIQGRYFLPFVAVAVVALPARRALGTWAGWVIAGACSAGLVTTSLALWARYYAQ
jgi:uncharacterized membrane protein